MISYLAIAIISIWVASGILSYGISFAFFQERYPFVKEQDYKRDRNFAVLSLIFGFVSLIVWLFDDEVWVKGYKLKYGLKFK